MKTDSESMRPFGKALLDYFKGNSDASIKIIREDGFESDLPASVFFPDDESSSPAYKLALSKCKGKILDVGAGAGRHSLPLQEMGFEVFALEINSEAVEVLKARKVRNVIHSDILDCPESGFDTILMMGHGLGICQDLTGLTNMLSHLKTLLVPEGMVVCDSLDVKVTEDPANLEYQSLIEIQERYRGETRFQVECQGQRGSMVKWLHVDPDTLMDYAQKAGYTGEVLMKDEFGNYTAQLIYKN